MALDTNFNVNPYYDDFDENKKFLRMLYKPGFAVQARELTQSQTLLQNQVDRFGRHVFRNGSVVEGGQFQIQGALYLKLDPEYSGNSIVANNFIGKTIFSTDDSKRAEVVKVFDAVEGGDPATLMVKQLFGNQFVAGETIKTSETTPVFANVSVGGAGVGQIFSINEGIFFYDGFFIKTDLQTIAVSKYTRNANVKIGLEVVESVVKSTTDTSLLDPAQDASNYQAPGADRYKVDLVLSTRAIDSTDLKKFIELAKVENGRIAESVELPVYSVIEDEFARRTYDESGNYTIRPFQLTLETNSSNTAQTNITLSPGKAYIFGYEYESKSPKTITVDKPREKEYSNNKFVSADYGSYIYTKNQFGSFPIDSLSTVDLHCVPNASINITSTGAISNTKIGTARISTIEFDSATDTSNSQTFVFRNYLFDLNINNSITGNANTATVNTVQIANTLTGNVFSTVTDAYKGAKLRITTGPGSNESPKTITAFNGTTQTLTLAENFVTTPTTLSKFSIDFEFNDAESLVVHSGTTRISSADIDDRSKDFASTYTDAIISETSLAPLLFDLGESYISNNISNLTFSYKKLFNTTFGSTDSGVLNLDTGEALADSSSQPDKLQDYQIIVINNKSSAPYANGSIVPPNSLTSVDTVLKKVSVVNANNMTANIIAKVTVSSSSPKAKSLIDENPTVQTTSGEDIFSNSAVLVYASEGQTTIASSYIVKTPDTPQSIFVSDVIELVQVLDFNGAAVANTGATDITERYSLDSGQRDSFYDHASIKLKPGFSAPVGPLVVRYKSYSSADEGGYFSVDSYPDYDDIPSYTSPVTGTVFSLRDCLDFRPVRKNATGSLAGAVEFRVGSLSDNPKIVQAGSDIVVSYQYYLPRVDKVVLNKNRTFEVIKGISARTPQEPKNKDNAMTLYILTNPAYTEDTRDINVEYINNRRYTMRDIGNIDKRVQNLEYYTSLSLLEQDTLTKQDLTILDSANLPRFKNGIITDSFTGHSVADVARDEYEASIDIVKKELRPSFNIEAFILDFDNSNSTNHMIFGPLVTANGTSSGFVDQPIASKSININPFQVTTFLGKIQLLPSSDIWVDTVTRPDVLVNVGNDKDSWDVLLTKTNATNWSYEYGDWQTRWTGQPVTTTTQFWSGGDLIERTTSITQSDQGRTGVGARVVAENVLTSVGDRIIDVSVIPFMRERTIRFQATDFKPSTPLYPFFDGVSIQNTTRRANEFILDSNNLNYRTDIRETVNIFDNDTATVNGTAWAVMTSNNKVYVVSTFPEPSFNIASANLVGTVSGSSYRIVGRNHYVGNASAVSSNTITLRIDADGANNISTYVGSNIYITSGTGIGQKRTITAYNASTRVANVDSNWTTLPTTTSTYGIGELMSDEAGRIAGLFTIPSGTFRTGEKLFRLMDSVTGDLVSSTTSGDASFFASGLLQTQEEVLVSTVQPLIQRNVVQEDRVITSSTSISDRVIFTQPPPPVFGGGDGGGDGGSDPLAQTFYVSPSQYPDGIFLDKIRICFRTKDSVMPVTCQLRPSVNGYPSSSIVYPYGSVSLTPDQVKITESPSLDDASKFTDFVFPAPVYLQPGEHSFVLLTNSLKYEVFVAEMGKLDLVSNLQISQQPYLGSLFLSQNASTWTADQNLDLMFRIFRKRFDTGAVNAEFRLEYPNEYSNSNTFYDLIHLISSEIILANTFINYSFISERETGGLTSPKSIVSLQDYEMNDGEGRRVLNPSTGNNTFILRAAMQTSNPDVSPVLDTSRFGFISVENKINNLPLSNADFVITNSGSGYTDNTSVTISAPDGSGTTANAYAVVSGGNVVSIIVDTIGSGYVKSPTVTIAAPPVPGGNTTATAIYNGEDKKSGGNSDARYITRKVTLADGFDSGDLRVYLTAYKPANSNILVYYKLLSKSDPEIFDDKDYQLMTEIGNFNFVSTNPGDYRELTFSPGINGTSNNSISYVDGSGSTFTTFKTFAVKIVMTGTDPTDVPKIRDFRAIAIPAG